jgi:DNA polymerase III epsilon subunit-like protein
MHKLYGQSISGLLAILSRYSEHTWVFFDTETTGLHPKSSQLTEIAAIAANVNRDVVNRLGEFRRKIKLTDATLRLLHDPSSLERNSWKRDNAKARNPMSAPQDILSMTRYGERGIEYHEENAIIESFYSFVGSYKSPLLIAQNAAFDMRMLSVRSGRTLARYPVLDTKEIIQHYFLPLLKSRVNLGKCQMSSSTLGKLAVRRGDRVHYSSSLGVVAHALGVDNTGWHSALADVEMMIDVYISIISDLEGSKSIDISREHAKSVALHR